MGVTEPAPAKVNLFLAVGPRRSDGYHELVTLFEPVPLFDVVRVELEPSAEGRGDAPCWEYRVRAAPPPTSPGLEIPPDLDNLAGRAAERFVAALRESGAALRASGPAGGRGSVIRVNIAKRIPVAAGLGGGSSDAAAVLRALQRLFGHPLAPERLQALAASLGADVPFFLRAERAVGRGRGEKLQPVPVRRRLPLVLALPSFQLSTPDVYRRLDERRSREHRLDDHRLDDGTAPEEGLAALLEHLAAHRLREAAAAMRNDLQEAALDLRPELGQVLGALRRAGSVGALVSGSGPTCFGLAPSLEAARQAARRAPDYLPADLKAGLTFLPVLSGRVGLLSSSRKPPG